MKPTKFDLMRANRDAHATRQWMAEAKGLPVATPEAMRAMSVPAVPFMEIDGVRYVEAPSEGLDCCAGCARKGATGLTCFLMEERARPVFGGSCDERGVIYIKAA